MNTRTMPHGTSPCPQQVRPGVIGLTSQSRTDARSKGAHRVGWIPVLVLVTLQAACGGSSGGGSSSTPTNGAGTGSTATSGSTPTNPPTTTTSGFTLTSPVMADGGTMPSEHSCDGHGGSPPLAWSGAPAQTQAYALLMTTIPADGITKYNWLLYNLPSSRSALQAASFSVGDSGLGSDGPVPGYQPPCSQGGGAKLYTFTLHALSAPVVPTAGTTPDGATLAALVAPLSLAKAVLNVSHTRSATPTGSSTACLRVRASLQGSGSATAQVACDGQYAHVSSEGLPLHAMMDGITATNLQVPTAQRFLGTNAWRIPLEPRIAETPTQVTDGPVGVAVNGVPIFNPCKQGGCQNGDVKALGELDVCNGHAGRADDYHYHAAPVCLMAGKAASHWDTHPIGWALDGFGIFGFNDADGKPATRDAVCGGNTNPVSNGPQGYKYHVTDTSPYVMACLRGLPSPDLSGQSAKFSPLRQPPVQPFAVSGMTLRRDASTGEQVLRFSSNRAFTTTETGADSYLQSPGAHQIRYRPLKGQELETALALPAHRNHSACWAFEFRTEGGATTQPSITYCR